MKRCLHVMGLVFLLNIGQSLAQPNFNWARNIGSGSGEYPESITTDANGNVLSTGAYQGSADLDPGTGFSPVNANGSFDAYISKLDASGNFVWGKSLGGSANDVGHSIVADAAGNVYIAGYFTGMADFDTGAGTYTMVANGSTDIFILKLDGAGNFVWAKQIGAANNDDANSIVLDNAGNIYLTGTFDGNVDFDPAATTYTMVSQAIDIFVCKLDGNGNFIWAKQLGDVNNELAYSIAVDAAQNVYTTGYFFMSADFDPGAAVYNLTAVGTGGFVSKLDASGNFVWAKAFSGNGCTSKCIKLDNSNNVYTTGYFESTIDFDPGAATYTLIPVGQSDIFVCKLDANGNFLWANSMGSTGYDRGFSLAIDASQDVYSTGYFQGTVDFDPGSGTYTLTSAGSEDIFITKFTTAGSHAWTYKMGGVNYDQGSSISIDASYNIYTTGYFSGSPDLDPTASSYTLLPSGSGDIFIQKLGQCVVPSSPANTTPTVNLLICQGNTTTLTATGSGTISWYSSATSTTALGSGTSFVTPTLTAGTYTYYAEAETCMLSASRTSVVFTVSACTGITKTLSQHNVYVYPNPVSDILHVSVYNHELLMVKIFNALGQKVIEKNMRDQNSKLDLSPLQKGIYVLELETEAGCVTKKIIKE